MERKVDMNQFFAWATNRGVTYAAVKFNGTSRKFGEPDTQKWEAMVILANSVTHSKTGTNPYECIDKLIKGVGK